MRPAMRRGAQEVSLGAEMTKGARKWSHKLASISRMGSPKGVERPSSFAIFDRQKLTTNSKILRTPILEETVW